MIIKIYQIKDIQNTIYAFRSYNEQMFDFKDYEKVAEFQFDAASSVVEALDKIYELGNSGTLKQLIPSMRSVSVSDIIEVDGLQWYVNDAGFEALGKVEVGGKE